MTTEPLIGMNGQQIGEIRHPGPSPSFNPFAEIDNHDMGDCEAPTHIVSHDELTRAGVMAASIEAVVDMASNVMSLAPDWDTRESYRDRMMELIRQIPNAKGT